MTKLGALASTGLAIAIIVLALASLAPRPAEAVKKETKKIAKAVVKNIVWRKLTTRHRIFPMPVPLPGKWQTVVSLLESSKMKDNERVGQASGNGYAQKSKRRDYSYLASDLRKFLKAINEGEIVANNNEETKRRNSAKAGNKVVQHNPLVTMYNIYRFASQSIKDEVLGDNKLILNNLYHDYNNPISQPPVISLNINNKKSFMNKLNYFNKPTDRQSIKGR